MSWPAGDREQGGPRTRRNSVLELRLHGNLRLMHKSYLRTYGIDEERRAYAELQKLMPQNGGIRLPKLYEELSSADEIVMEFVPGPTLGQMLAKGEVSALYQHQAELCGVMAASARKGSQFDFDPSNILVSGDSLIVVDPVIVPLPLRHMSAAIFLHGLVKAAFRGLLRPWILPDLATAWRSTFAAYCAEACVSAAVVLRDLAAYQATVVEWNRQPAAGESFFLRLSRRALLIPAYQVIRLLVLRRAAHPRSQ